MEESMEQKDSELSSQTDIEGVLEEIQWDVISEVGSEASISSIEGLAYGGEEMNIKRENPEENATIEAKGNGDFQTEKKDQDMDLSNKSLVDEIQKNNELNMQLINAEAEICRLKDVDENQKRRVQNLENEKLALEEKLSCPKSENSQMTGQNQDNKIEIETLRSENEQLKNEKQQLLGENKRLNFKITETQKINKALVKKVSMVSARKEKKLINQPLKKEPGIIRKHPEIKPLMAQPIIKSQVTEVMEISNNIIKHVVGKQGKMINYIKTTYDVVITMRENPEKGENIVKITGLEGNVRPAVKHIQGIVDKKAEEKDDKEETTRQPTVPCKFFLEGTCNKGDKCNFLHPKPEFTTVCKFYMEGKCAKGEMCTFIHPIAEDCHDEVEICKFYLKGICKNGVNCRFAHPQAEPDYWEESPVHHRSLSPMESERDWEYEEERPALEERYRSRSPLSVSRGVRYRSRSPDSLPAERYRSRSPEYPAEDRYYREHSPEAYPERRRQPYTSERTGRRYHDHDDEYDSYHDDRYLPPALPPQEYY